VDYKEAGVDTVKAQNYIKSLKDSITATHKNARFGSVVDNFGGFAGIFKPDKSLNGQQLVASTDGVGTKIELAKRFKFYEGLGYDLLAMCINDLYCVGATPLFFLDYISCGKLDDSWYFPVMRSIASACEKTSVALLGGETAEHPGVMNPEDFDLAGFIVGMASPEKIMPKLSEVREGDGLFAFSSSGLHSNGFSLVRKILEKIENENPSRFQDLSRNPEWIEKILLAPTRIFDFIPKLTSEAAIKGIAHITGGGIYENLERVLPEGMSAFVENPGVFPHEIFKLLSEFTAPREMYKAFNMGMGMIVVADLSETKTIESYGAKFIGKVQKSNGDTRVILKGIDT
jgi:phosphoribosylformylglycinamidine cyclo-ligase